MNLEKTSKVLLLVCGIILILLGVPRLLLNTWVPFSNYLFYICLSLFILALSLKYKALGSFLTMRTTKHGLNMGTLITVGFLFYLSVNFLSARYDKSFDITADKLNSLSLQSTDILKSLKDDVEFRVYYPGGTKNTENIGLKLLFKKYTRETKYVNIKFIDAYKDPSSGEYLTRDDKGKVVVFVKKGKKIERVNEPVGEETLTSALYRIQKTNNKKIYFLTGHGERSLSSSENRSGLGVLNEALLEKGFLTSELNLISTTKIPEDASMLAIVGPQKNLLENELEIIRSYTSEGGRLLLALDPGVKVDYSLLSEPLGVKFKNNFILTTQPVSGGDALSIVGQDFNKENKITEKLSSKSIMLFYEATELEESKEGLDYEKSSLIKTVPTVIPVTSLNDFRSEIKGKEVKSVIIAMTSKKSVVNDGHEHEHDEDLEEKGESPFFFGAFFGDSDFLTDLYFETGFNKDVAINAFASLSGEMDLVSIHPRVAKSTKMILTSVYSTFVIIFPLLIPLLLLVISVVIWFRRRGA